MPRVAEPPAVEEPRIVISDDALPLRERRGRSLGDGVFAVLLIVAVTAAIAAITLVATRFEDVKMRVAGHDTEDAAATSPPSQTHSPSTGEDPAIQSPSINMDGEGFSLPDDGRVYVQKTESDCIGQGEDEASAKQEFMAAIPEDVFRRRPAMPLALGHKSRAALIARSVPYAGDAERDISGGLPRGGVRRSRG